MWQNAYDTYLESRIYAAEPIELVRLLYQAASNAVREARRQLAAGDIRERSRSITKASEILLEMAGSLNHEQGGAISRNLARLYDYMLGRLSEANLRQKDEPLAEVLALLSTLSEAWDGVKNQVVRDGNVPQCSWAQPGYETTAGVHAGQGWSL